MRRRRSNQSERGAEGKTSRGLHCLIRPIHSHALADFVEQPHVVERPVFLYIWAAVVLIKMLQPHAVAEQRRRLFHSTDIERWEIDFVQAELAASQIAGQHELIEWQVVGNIRVGSGKEVANFLALIEERWVLDQVFVLQPGDLGDDFLDNDSRIADELYFIQNLFAISYHAGEFDDSRLLSQTHPLVERESCGLSIPYSEYHVCSLLCRKAGCFRDRPEEYTATAEDLRLLSVFRRDAAGAHGGVNKRRIVDRVQGRIGILEPAIRQASEFAHHMHHEQGEPMVICGLRHQAVREEDFHDLSVHQVIATIGALAGAEDFCCCVQIVEDIFREIIGMSVIFARPDGFHGERRGVFGRVFGLSRFSERRRGFRKRLVEGRGGVRGGRERLACHVVWRAIGVAIGRDGEERRIATFQVQDVGVDPQAIVGIDDVLAIIERRDDLGDAFDFLQDVERDCPLELRCRLGVTIRPHDEFILAMFGDAEFAVELGPGLEKVVVGSAGDEENHEVGVDGIPDATYSVRVESVLVETRMILVPLPFQGEALAVAIVEYAAVQVEDDDAILWFAFHIQISLLVAFWVTVLSMNVPSEVRRKTSPFWMKSNDCTFIVMRMDSLPLVTSTCAMSPTFSTMIFMLHGLPIDGHRVGLLFFRSPEIAAQFFLLGRAIHPGAIELALVDRFQRNINHRNLTWLRLQSGHEPVIGFLLDFLFIHHLRPIAREGAGAGGDAVRLEQAVEHRIDFQNQPAHFAEYFLIFTLGPNAQANLRHVAESPQIELGRDLRFHVGRNDCASVLERRAGLQQLLVTCLRVCDGVMPQAVQLFADVVGRVMLAIDRSRFVEFPAECFRLNDGADFQSATGFLLVSPGASPNELMGEILADALDLENEVHELERRADGVQHVLPVVELFGLGHGRRVLAAHAG
ncbi:hypothetical protein [Pseudomonas phage BL3]|nr:hypothetical protein [Pseudomonas phage BL3]